MSEKNNDKKKNDSKRTKVIQWSKKHPVLTSSIVVGVVVSVVGGGLLLTQYIESTRPLGNEDVIETTALMNQNETVGQTSSSNSENNHLTIQQSDEYFGGTDRGYNYLYEANIPLLTNQDHEFEGGEQYLNNMLNLIASGLPTDWSEAGALARQNIDNYNFSEEDNITLGGVSRDALRLGEYINSSEDTSGVAAIRNLEELGRQIGSSFSTPMTMVLSGAHTGVYGGRHFIYDSRSISTILPQGAVYNGTKQYKANDPLISDVSSYTKGLELNPLRELVDTTSETLNSIYEVTFSSAYWTEDTPEYVGYVAENLSGELFVYGIYKTTPYGPKDSTFEDIYLTQYTEDGDFIEDSVQTELADYDWNSFTDLISNNSFDMFRFEVNH